MFSGVFSILTVSGMIEELSSGLPLTVVIVGNYARVVPLPYGRIVDESRVDRREKLIC